MNLMQITNTAILSYLAERKLMKCPPMSKAEKTELLAALTGTNKAVGRFLLGEKKVPKEARTTAQNILRQIKEIDATLPKAKFK